MDTMALKAGDAVYFHSAVRYMNSGTVTVARVGRKWIELSNDCRVERGSTVCDNRGVGASPGTIWPDEAAWQDWNTRSRRWYGVKSYMRDAWNMPKHLTDQDLDDLERILRLGK